MSEIKINPSGKVVFISGANRGIGKALVEEFLRQGAQKVYAGARDITSLDQFKTYGSRLVPVQLDVTDDVSIKAAAARATDVEILVNNAGILTGGGFLSAEAINNLNNQMKVNVIGLINLTQAFIDTLKSQRQAAIVNLGSLASLANMPSIGTYSTSKAAVHSITQGLRGELAQTNILVTGVYPGAIDTEMTKGMEMTKDTAQNVARNIVIGLVAGKEDIYPDAMSAEVGKGYLQDPKAVEKNFATYVG